MSSIYKKGRDGYYYYQAYVYNPNSNKKDKRIFHSLGTKDTSEARAKQAELDKKYNRQINFKYKNSRKFSNISYNIKIIMSTIILTTFFSIIIGKYINNDRNIEPEINQGKTEDFINLNEKVTISTGMKPNTISPNNQIELSSQITESTYVNDSDATIVKVEIPKYSIERVDRLPGVFEQGRVYVTIDRKTSYKSQILLCEKIAKSYSEFSNIVICLYSNDIHGKNLAIGNDKIVSVEQKKQAWLAMYSYNAVEGQYFDDKPGSYLGYQ